MMDILEVVGIYYNDGYPGNSGDILGEVLKNYTILYILSCIF